MSTNSWHEKGVASLTERKFREALDFFKKAIEEEPSVGIHYSEAALVLLVLRERSEALEYSEKAMALDSKDSRVRAYHASVLVEFDRSDEAMALFNEVIAENPDYAPIYCRFGQALILMGRLEEAEHAFRRGIALDPKESRNYYHLVRIVKLERDDVCFQQLEALAPEFDSYPTNARVDFHFALGQALYKLGEADCSFEHLAKANDLRHRSTAFDDRHTVRSITTNVRLVDVEAVAKRRNQGNSSEAPIFIISMPRAGSTLVEQVLASHPAVMGLEEHATFDVARGLIGGFPLHYPMLGEDEDQYVASKLSALGTQYLQSVYERFPDAAQHQRFTDKSIDNYQHIGLMHLALPKARFIHVRRSILDTCLSIFTYQFSGLGYGYSLGEIGKYYRIYHESMRHWAKVLPSDLMLEVEYEQLVLNFEYEARRMVEYCGLEWDEKCLSFHDTKRVVRTVSNTQVRKPLYRDSLKRLRPNDELLQPLFSSLGAELTSMLHKQEAAKQNW